MNSEINHAIDTIKAAMIADPEYAWAWFCNISVPLMDAAYLDHRAANGAAAYLMYHLFDYDITTHPKYEYGKTRYHRYVEARIAAGG